MSNRFRSQIIDIRAQIIEYKLWSEIKCKKWKEIWEKKIVNIFKIQSGNKNML